MFSLLIVKKKTWHLNLKDTLHTQCIHRSVGKQILPKPLSFTNQGAQEMNSFVYISFRFNLSSCQIFYLALGEEKE